MFFAISLHPFHLKVPRIALRNPSSLVFHHSITLDDLSLLFIRFERRSCLSFLMLFVLQHVLLGERLSRTRPLRAQV